jgi:surface antigen
LTLGKLVSAVFTDNSGVGPTMGDAIALFNASHGSNLGTSALSWDNYNTARIAMMKQTEVNSSERLGALTAPKYCLVPIDLEITALQMFASEGEPGTSDNDENVHAVGESHRARMQSARSRVVTVPLWTDTNDWALAADPRLYPGIAIGYRYGRTPEIFSVASPTAGLMFTNDTLPVKVRFFVAVGPVDYRGLYKANVT